MFYLTIYKQAILLAKKKKNCQERRKKNLNILNIQGLSSELSTTSYLTTLKTARLLTINYNYFVF